MPGIYHINGVNTKQKHHQTEKPVELLKALIQILSLIHIWAWR